MEIEKKLKVTISNGNDKMGRIPSFSLPPVLTCSHCEACSKKCYALRLAKLRKTVAQSWLDNLEIWQKNPKAVELAIKNTAVTSSVFRYFVGGDIPDAQFLKMMVKTAKEFKNCTFLAFTKKHELINAYLYDGGRLPKNLKIIMSGWGEDLKPFNPFNLPTSDVIFKGQEIPQNAKICDGDCTACKSRGIGCWVLKKGEKIYFLEH